MSKIAKVISEARANLVIVSKNRGDVENLAKLTENETLKTFILSQGPKMDEDISYLRKKIVYQVQKYAANLNVDQFNKLAENLESLVS